MRLLFAASVGLFLPTLLGWLLLRLTEWKSPILGYAERWIMGFVLGGTAGSVLITLVHGAGLIRITAGGMVTIMIIAIGVCALLVHRQDLWLTTTHSSKPSQPANLSGPLTPVLRLCVIIFSLWVICKIIAAGSLLLWSPPYHDDVIDNWNYRGSVFVAEERLVLSDTPDHGVPTNGGGVFSYPPTLPLLKAWIASLNGEWNHGLVNIYHILWYIAVLFLVYFTLRRSLSVLWSLLGSYLLSGIPLYLMHGSAAYADIFLSLHILIAISTLFYAVQLQNAKSSAASLRISVLAAALMTFTKNEGLVLYFGPYLLVLAGSVLWLLRTNALKALEVRKILSYSLVAIGVIVVPWILFKLTHGLTFGNAKGIGSLTLQWQPDVPYAIWINTFFEGNWNLLPACLIGLMILQWRKMIGSPLLILFAFLTIAYGGQVFAFLLTTIGSEAVQQTGYGRGVIHLVPLAILLTVLLLHSIMRNRKWEVDSPGFQD